MAKVYTVTEPLNAVRTYEVKADTRSEALDLVMMGKAGEGTTHVQGPQRLLKVDDVRVVYDPADTSECLECGHPVRTKRQLASNLPGTRVAVGGVCSRCRGAGIGQEIATHCMVCDRRLRGWGVRAAEDPEGAQRGDARRCGGCKYGNREVLTVDELNETETNWVEHNVPTDLHWYFGVGA